MLSPGQTGILVGHPRKVYEISKDTFHSLSCIWASFELGVQICALSILLLHVYKYSYAC